MAFEKIIANIFNTSIAFILFWTSIKLKIFAFIDKKILI